MEKDQLLGLHPDSLTRPDEPPRLLTEEEIVYIATTLGAFWAYNYEALREGKPGFHAELKSGLHSDGFFYSKILLESWNMGVIMADQIALRFKQLAIAEPDWVAGIPKGATKLGEDVAQIMGVKNAEMQKETERIELVSFIGPGESLLLVEDFCTRGTGFTEAVQDILSKQPQVKILPYELVILNRGGLKEIVIEGVGSFQVVAVVEHRVNDWEPEECPLCKMGSKPIKPKATDENWRLITTSQQ
jgi:orotate phosphoribosyltransferase